MSIVEITIGFQGMHKDKRRITYKTGGDGFQCDALCNYGFTYQVYFRNEPADKKLVQQGMSPLHARVVSLMATLKDKFHICGMDNLYNSALFCKRCYSHPMKVKVQGVARKGGRGIPPQVLQDEVKSLKGQREVRGTVRAAVLQGDTGCPNLVVLSIYDTKLVHFLSMACTSL